MASKEFSYYHILELWESLLRSAKREPLKCLIGLSTAAFLLNRLKSRRKSSDFPPPFAYPLRKDANYASIKKHKKNGTLPKIFNAQEKIVH